MQNYITKAMSNAKWLQIRTLLCMTIVCKYVLTKCQHLLFIIILKAERLPETIHKVATLILVK